MPRLWTIRAYVTGGNRDVLKEWYEAQTPRVRAKFDTQIKFLAHSPRLDWKREPFAPLSNAQGMGEIRFFSDKVQHRPIGYFGPGQMEFTILFCAKEKGGKFVPKGALKTAEDRMKEIKKDPGRSVICEWLWDDDEEV